MTLLLRTWRELSNPEQADAALVVDLASALQNAPNDAGLLNLQGALFQANNPGDLASAADAFQRAWTSDPRHVVAGLNLAEILLRMGQKKHAVEQAQRTLALLERLPELPVAVLEAPHVLMGYDLFRREWNLAGNADGKRRLIRWRLHRLLAELTCDLVHEFQAYAARPDLAASQAALGFALERAQRPADAMPFLRSAHRQNPEDANIGRAYYRVLGQLGLTAEQQIWLRERPELVGGDAGAGLHAEVAQLKTGDIASRSLRIAWQGAQKAVHSLALVNREICTRLLERGHELSLIRPSNREPDQSTLALDADLEGCLNKPLSGPADVHISHQWPPDFCKPPAGRWVIMQPWEYGSLPRAWLAPLTHMVDEVWVPSNFVRASYIKSGVPAEKVHVIPLGVAPVFFESRPAWPLKTRKRFRFLFVGGTIERKGFDLLLKAYHQVFAAQDDVCLVIKDMGVGTFYQGQTAQDRISQYQGRPHAPEVEYLTQDLTTAEMAGLYAACHCLVHPYRGEGFGLPIAEALASGLPVSVTGSGAALDFCRDEHAYLIPARIVRLAQKRISELETVDFPSWAEPDQDGLRLLLRHIVENYDEAKGKGERGREFIRENFTWEHTVGAVERRLEELIRPQKAGQSLASSAAITAGWARGTGRVSLTMIVKNEQGNLAACLDSVAGLVEEIIVVDTGSADGTVEIAKGRGAKVFHFPWIDSFAAARNEALRHATGEWIFWMDADDRLDADNRTKLKTLLETLPRDMIGFVMKCLCLPDPESGTATVVDHVRLFPNHPELRWTYRIHEQILGGIRRLGGTVRWSDVVIHHVGYQDMSVRHKKLERDLRLLNLENQENPDDPFTLFNLGSVYLEQGLPAKAVDVLERSLQRSNSSDSIVRKLYSLLAHCHRLIGNLTEATKTCLEGRKVYPEDPEILFQESLALQKSGDRPGAIARLLQIVAEKDGAYFASVDAGLRGCKAHHNLAVLYQETAELHEAERHWQLALEKEPGYLPSLTGLADLYLKRGQAAEFQDALQALERHPRGQREAVLLKARKQLTDKDYRGARAILDSLVASDPDFLPAWIIRSHTLLQEGSNSKAAEAALREVLRRDPNNAEARRNLQLLLGG